MIGELIGGLVERIALVDNLRPELSLSPEKIEENRILSKKPERINQITDKIALYEQDVTKLRHGGRIIKYLLPPEPTIWTKSKPVIVTQPLTEPLANLERKLKIELYMRGANAGVCYKTAEHETCRIAQAIPAEVYHH